MPAERPFHFQELEGRLVGDPLASGTSPIQGTVARLSTSERPLQGWAGYLDWRGHGALSEFILQGWISGAPQESVLVSTVISPWKNPFWVLLVGTDPVTPATLSDALASQIRTMGPNLRWGIPLSEFSDTTEKQAEAWLKKHLLQKNVEFFKA